MTMADIRAIEDRTKEELERLRREGEVRGMRAENEQAGARWGPPADDQPT